MLTTIFCAQITRITQILYFDHELHKNKSENSYNLWLKYKICVIRVICVLFYNVSSILLRTTSAEISRLAASGITMD